METAVANSLTALERELLSYVERLTLASEQSAAQFKDLELRSSALITKRQDQIENSLRLLIASQASLITGLIKLAKGSGISSQLPPELIESEKAIVQAAKDLSEKA